MVYDEPESSKFLAAVQRLKRRQLRTHRQTRQAKQRLRAMLRKPSAEATPEGESASLRG